MVSNRVSQSQSDTRIDQFSAYNDLSGVSGRLPTHWEELQQNMTKVGNLRLVRSFREAQRLLRESGAIHSLADPHFSQRGWQLDPVPLILDEKEWAHIEAGMIQRAELFNLILNDLYGPRTLIQRHLLPPELVFAHSGFLYPCAAPDFASERRLNFYSAVLARGTDGNTWVVGDHVRPPYGGGYALEARLIMARSFPQLFEGFKVHRLAMFFRAVRQRLAQLALHHRNEPRIVILSPGPGHPDYSEHAYLASYLGYPLVQSGDLVVRDQKVWLKSVDGLRQVDVIFSRLVDDACDPLELRADSDGVPGLVHAVRQGHVSLSNPIGSSLLENPALLAFLPAICRFFLGRELILPSIATWWCGQPDECRYVLDHLDRLIVRPIHPVPGLPVSSPSAMSSEQLQRWHDLICANPRLFVGQQQVDYMAFPSFDGKRIVPRRSLLSSYAVADDSSYQIMPGGLSRVALNGENLLMTGQRGGGIKDTWVLTPEIGKQVNLWLQAQPDQLLAPRFMPLPSRSAENLFWAGRYAERTEQTGRLMRSILVKLREVNEFGDPDDRISLNHLLRSLTHVTQTYPGFTGDDARQMLKDPRSEILSLVRDLDRAGSLRSSLRSLARSAVAVRDLLPEDAWRLVDQLQSWNPRVSRAQIGSGKMYDSIHQLVLQLSAFSGLAYENMSRETAWMFLNIGRRIERALNLIDLLRVTLVPCYSAATEARIMETVLSSCNSLVVFRRRYRSFMQLSPILDLLLFDEHYPRALACQLRQMKRHIAELPQESPASATCKDETIIADALAALLATDHKSLIRRSADACTYPLLEEALLNQKHRLEQLSETLMLLYFSPTLALHRLGASAQERMS